MAIAIVSNRTSEMTEGRKSDLEVALTPLMIFGKILGIVPTSNKTFRWNIILIVLLLLNTVVELYGTCRKASGWRTPLDVAQSIGMPAFFTNGFFIYYYINRNMDRLRLVFHEWKICEGLTMKKDTKLFRDVNFWAGLVFTSAILENLLFHVKLCAPMYSEDTFLKCAFQAFGGSWPQFFYPSEFLGVYHILTNKLALYAWNFMDILIIILSRGIYFQFKVIGEATRSGNSWSTLRAEFSQAMRLLTAAEEFLSPMVFASYGMNTYALCMQLNLWLTPTRNKNTIDSMYSVWSSLHLVVRVLLVSISAANINASAAKVLDQLAVCPNEAYNMDIYRLEEMVMSTPLGLTGQRCFMVTRHFILTLLGVVFTFEVVLLQSFSATLQNTK